MHNAQSVLVRTRDTAVGSSDSVGPAMAAVVRDAVLKHYGSVKAAALSLEVDPSLMQREFDAGKFGRLERDPDLKAVVASALYDAFGKLDDPKARTRRSIRAMRALLDEFEQFVDFV